MTEVVSVKFKNRGKSYFFAPNGIDAKDGDELVVETANGLEIAHCCYGNHNVEETKVVPPLRPVVRIATASDLKVVEQNRIKEKEALKVCKELVARHELDMKLVDVECNFEGTKTLFFFTSDGRVDFRELVKDLAGIFRNRIELRQIGVRDEAKMLGGIGVCGRQYCCNSFFDEFHPVSTKMAKVQNLSLNPTKISGSCGRLMCCLRYEEEAYEQLLKEVPKTGTFVETADGYGNVSQVTLLRRKVKVKLDTSGDEQIKQYSVDEIAVIPGGRPKAGEPLPKLLKDKPKIEPIPVLELEDPLKSWIVDDGIDRSPQKPEQERRHRNNKQRNDNRQQGDKKPKIENKAKHESKPKPNAPNKAKHENKPKPNPNNQKPRQDKPVNAEKKQNPNQHRAKNNNNRNRSRQRPPKQESGE